MNVFVYTALYRAPSDCISHSDIFLCVKIVMYWIEFTTNLLSVICIDITVIYGRQLIIFRNTFFHFPCFFYISVAIISHHHCPTDLFEVSFASYRSVLFF